MVENARIHRIHDTILKFLIMATGPSMGTHREQIEAFIKRKMPVTIGCNYMKPYVPDYHVFTNKRRYKDHWKDVNPKSKLILGSNFERGIIKHKVYDTLNFENKYPSEKGWLKIFQDHIYCEGGTTSAAMIGMAIQKWATEILFVGLDGLMPGKMNYYKAKFGADNDKRMIQDKAMRMILKQVSRQVKVAILTPTVYKEYYENSLT